MMQAVKRISALALLIAVAIVAPACIREENTVTVYLDPNGQVTWSIFEKNVRSDEKTRDARQAEEDAFIIAARVHQHPAMTALQRLGASSIKDTILQDKPPFTVMTEGRFRNLEEWGRRLMTTYGFAGSSVVSRDDDKWIWTLTFEDVPDELKSEQDQVELVALVGDKLHVALREGEFIQADGFTINDDKRMAELSGDLIEPVKQGAPPKVVKLVWRLE